VHRGHHFNDAIADDASEEGHPSLNLSHTFGDVRLKVDDKDFKGGAVDNIFGNIEIDLEEAEIKEGSYRLHLSGIFGDQNIILPKNQAVSIEAGTSFGTVRIKDRNSSGFSGVLKWSTPDFTQSERRLHIQVKQVFGDIRVF
jgi:predicted membrane protein